MVDFTHLTPALQSVFTIEVKSSTNYTITSLQKFIKKFSRQLATPPPSSCIIKTNKKGMA